MNLAYVVSLLISIPLILFGCYSIYKQVKNKKKLAQEAFVPPDEKTYLQTLYFRRIFCGVLMVLIGGMIAGTYLSGFEAKADAGRAAFQQQPDQNGKPPPPTEEERRFFRIWSIYWIIVICLLGLLLFIAFTDAWATRKHGLKILRELRDEHKAKLARDLAVFKIQKSDRFSKQKSDGPPNNSGNDAKDSDDDTGEEGGSKKV